MDRKERIALYEKLYFHELERREKISSRLALPFAAIVATVGLLSFMLNKAARPLDSTCALAFWSTFGLSCFFLALSAWFFRKAWFGHTDKLLPTANSIEEYHSALEKTYEDFDEREQLVSEAFEDFLFSYYADFSTANATNNDARSYNIYRTTVALTISLLLAFVAAIPFFLGQPATETLK